ncbi:MAG: HigA family addiction module antitoxin [bacterium]
MLLEEFLKPMGISQYRLAQDIGIPAMRINKIVRGESCISADTALRLARHFGMSVEFWTGIQNHYDTEMVKMELADRRSLYCLNPFPWPFCPADTFLWGDSSSGGR